MSKILFCKLKKEIVLSCVSVTLLVLFIFAAADKFKAYGEESDIEETVNQDKIEYLYPEKYYYMQLSDIQRREFHKIYNGILNKETSIEINGLSVDDLERIIYIIHFDCPEIFYLSDSAQNYNHKGNMVTMYYPQYTYDKTQIEHMEEEISIYTDFFFDEMGDVSDEAAELYIHDYIVNNVSYSQTSPDYSNIYGTFIHGKANCKGYSSAFTYLCRKYGIDSTQVIGNGTTKGTSVGHSWNTAKLGDSYYYVDVCWDDLDSLYEYGEIPGIHSYYNLPAAKMNLSHNPKETLQFLGQIPSDKDSSQMYYKKRGCYADSITEAERIIRKQFAAPLDSKKFYVIVQCDSKDSYNTLKSNASAIIKKCIEESGQAYVGCRKIEIPDANTLLFADFVSDDM